MVKKPCYYSRSNGRGARLPKNDSNTESCAPDFEEFFQADTCKFNGGSSNDELFGSV